jgi:hypothetical protein
MKMESRDFEENMHAKINGTNYVQKLQYRNETYNASWKYEK